MPQFAVILPAAGQSTRFGGTRNKLLESLGGQTVLARSLRAFSARDDMSVVVVVAAQERLPSDEAKVVFAGGGASRAQSVRNALALVPASVEWVAVHDAARPLVSNDLIDRVVAAAVQHGAAAPALPLTWTIREAAGPLPAKAGRTVPRERLWAMQTPQVMRRGALLDAFGRCPIPLEKVTDDVQLLELAGYDVWLVPGDERNLKITTPMDLKLAELLLRDTT